MRSDLPQLVPYETLPLAWSWCLTNVGTRSGPFLLSLSDFDDDGLREDAELRGALDAVLRAGKKTVTTEDNAAMIFPSTLWRLSDGDREQFFDRYIKKTYRRLRRRGTGKHASGKVPYGTYFIRMVDYHGTKADGQHKTKNQLNHLIERWHSCRDKGKRPRESELQLALFDPPKDHTGQSVRGFPCLQQISLSYDNGGLTLTALYPTQYIFERAYGNYVGLARLGQFLAGQMGLEFLRLNCLIVAPHRGNVRVSDMAQVLARARALLAAEVEAADE